MSELKKCVLITAFSIYGVACLFGLIGGILRSTTPDEECTYNSLMARTNLGYVVGCELAKPRFKGITRMTDFLHTLRYGKFSFHWGKPRGRLGFYHAYYDGEHYSLNLYFFSIGLDY